MYVLNICDPTTLCLCSLLVFDMANVEFLSGDAAHAALLQLQSTAGFLTLTYHGNASRRPYIMRSSIAKL